MTPDEAARRIPAIQAPRPDERSQHQDRQRHENERDDSAESAGGPFEDADRLVGRGGVQHDRPGLRGFEMVKGVVEGPEAFESRRHRPRVDRRPDEVDRAGTRLRDSLERGHVRISIGEGDPDRQALIGERGQQGSHGAGSPGAEVDDL